MWMKLDIDIYFHTFQYKSQTWFHCLSSHPFIPTDQGCRLSRGPCSGGVGEAEGGVGTLGKSPCPIYSCFEKGCWKKCTLQSPKVLWVVFSSLFFKEISKNCTRGHGRMFSRAKGKQQNKVRQLQGQEQVYWSYPILPFGIVACTAFATTFLEIAIYVCYYVFVDIFSLSLSLNFIVCHYFTCHFKIWNDDVLLKAMLLASIFFP